MTITEHNGYPGPWTTQLHPNFVVRFLARLLRPVVVECNARNAVLDGEHVRYARKIAAGQIKPLRCLVDRFPELRQHGGSSEIHVSIDDAGRAQVSKG